MSKRIKREVKARVINVDAAMFYPGAHFDVGVEISAYHDPATKKQLAKALVDMVSGESDNAGLEFRFSLRAMVENQINGQMRTDSEGDYVDPASAARLRKLRNELAALTEMLDIVQYRARVADKPKVIRVPGAQASAQAQNTSVTKVVHRFTVGGSTDTQV